MAKRDGRRWRWWQWVLSVVLAVAIAVPVVAAVMHRGYAGTDVVTSGRDVWVVNHDQRLAGRLDTQIQELTGSFGAATDDFEVLQDGDEVFVHDGALGTLSRLDPATGVATETVSVPGGSDVEIRAGMLAVLERATGSVWVASTRGPLDFDPRTSQPVLELGPSAQLVVTVRGEVVAAAVGDQSIYRVSGTRTFPQRVPLGLELTDFEITAVGDEVVLFDVNRQELYFDNGRVLPLAESALHVQEVSEAGDVVALATPTGLSLIPFEADGRPDSIGAGGGAQDASNDPDAVARPVVFNGCHFGAWGALAVVVGGCPGQADLEVEIVDPLEGGTLEFRVGGGELALNNTRTGVTYLPMHDMRAVDNWDEVLPEDRRPEDQLAEPEIDVPLSETLDGRTDVNRPPVLEDDLAGVRPGSTVVIPVLANDTDPDGDVLRITGVEPVGAPVGTAAGKVDLIDDGRALRFTADEGVSGSLAFAYHVSDGRSGGTADAIVRIRIVDDGSNSAPQQLAPARLRLEQGKTGSLDVLEGWVDAEGDPVHLVAASGDDDLDVRFTPDGEVTVAAGAEPGHSTVNLVASDGADQSSGVLELEIAAPGTLNPDTAANFATGTTDAPVTVEVTANDVGVGGDPPVLVDAVETQGRPGISFDEERGTVTLDAPLAGVYSVVYTVQVGERTAKGILRVDIADASTLGTLAPIAVPDAVHLQGMQPGTVDLLNNDSGDPSRVLAVIGLDDTVEARAAGLQVELIDHAILRVTPTRALSGPIELSYVLSDGQATDVGTIVVTPGSAIEQPRPPVTEPDAVTVRAGDIAVVAPLANDTHPDRLDLRLDDDLTGTTASSDDGTATGDETADGEMTFGDGIAHVDGDVVRLQAPTEPGTYTLGYRVIDPLGGSATDEITVTVTEVDAASNRPPEPVGADVRASQGTPVRIDVPLAGADPDGDFVTVTGIPESSDLGVIVEVDATGFTFVPHADAHGTETLPITVSDAFGASSMLPIRIGVVPAPAASSAPVAVDDVVTVPPGMAFSVPVLDNDSDPAGLELSLASDVPENDVGASVTVDGDALVIAPPEGVADFSVGYTVTNAAGATSTASVHVSVRDDASLPAPSAANHVIGPDALRGTTVVDVAVRDGAENPAGAVADLMVELVDSDAPATIDGGVVRVQAGDERLVIPYRVTSPATGASTVGFIVVSPLPRI
ncbi:hypothetical protein GCM10011490_13200 [Pseudoclavibacter endophyticus]|uniref:Tandem-95 repeat protein n=1 Tax=Pseudoclavibacter endophyticus TaxID=1778590 RepID=A0A6H9WSF7_9MICO|nr:Ig-like domain-containing protein [Pseudoclavibacter endophyticus]KAB1649274.1 hypothetical protein F8O04_03095 [Pseudoclavibacter endophyticus]GGA63928.1 hypothetical protein GCM10011490_13200 [Pseudoclavibacter endophyticus]